MAQPLRSGLRGAFGLSLALAAAVPAHATSFSFDFVNQSYTNSATNKQTFNATGGTGSTPLFTRTVSGQSVQLQMSAYFIDTSTAQNKTYNAQLNFYSGGIGITDANESSTSPNHAIDNNNGVDFLVLQFSKAVNLSSINIGWIYNDSDATIRYGNAPGAWNVLPAINNVAYGAAGGLGSMLNPSVIAANGGTATGSRATPNGGFSDFWIISAANPNPIEGSRSKADYFKVASIVVSDFPPLPEPGTWMTMIFGFGAIAAMMRRRHARPVSADGLAA
ncbi:MAG: PEP-CTERM sorting domain-containing protein [Sphingomonadales bacterium]|nr:PEP-CTERM sorting domain-containing protein [Sphingomonadales bacterium]